MTQTQLTAALNDLEKALSEGAEELSQKPEQYALVKSLYAELKKLKPGVTLPPKVVKLLQAFVAEQIDEDIRDHTKLLVASQAQKGAVAVKVSAAHKSVLQALSKARDGLGALDPNLAAGAAGDTVVRMNNANDAAAAAVRDAEAAAALAPRPAKK